MFFSYPCIAILFVFLVLIVRTTSSDPCPWSDSNATTIYDALSNHALPRGLFPEGVKDFSLGTDGHFWVHLDKACNAKFESSLHYDSNVSGSLSCGKIDSLSGMEAQDLFLWLPVVSIRVDIPSSGLIYIDVGAASKKFAASLFEKPPECVAVLPEVSQDGSSWKAQVSSWSGNFWKGCSITMQKWDNEALLLSIHHVFFNQMFVFGDHELTVPMIWSCCVVCVIFP